MIELIENEEPLVRLESGLLVPEEFAEQMAREQLKFTGVDVFAGAGGLSLGAIQAGLNVVAAVEDDCCCVAIYMSNLCRWGQVRLHFVEDEDEERLEKFLRKEIDRQEKNIKKRVVSVEYPRSRRDLLSRLCVAGSGWISGQSSSVPGVSHMIVGDVRKLTGKRMLDWIGLEKGELGCMFGGPPCQGFSYMGRHDAADPRNPLVFEFARLIVETQPKTCVMENVPGILTMKTPDGVPVVDRFCAILRDGGFQGVEAFEAMVRRPGTAGAIHLRPVKKKKKRERKVQLELRLKS